MLNYLVDPGVLAGRVPRGTELDTFEGRTFISIVGFRFLDTRVLGIPVPWHRNFEEINLRFYVRRETGSETRRGVVFIKEIVPRPMIALIARRLYNENYVSMPMTHFDEVGLRKEPRVAYSFRHSTRMNRVEVRACGAPYLPEETSEEAFITEHYWGYARQRDGSTLEYEVRHLRWNVWRTSEARFDAEAGEIYGPELGRVLSAPPHSGFLADGSAVAVYRGTPL